MKELLSLTEGKSLYIIEMIMALAVVSYTIIVILFSGHTPTAIQYVHDYWITQAVVIVMLVPSLISIVGLFAKGRSWIDFRLNYTLILVIGMLFLGVITLLTVGVESLSWVTFIAMALVAAVCHINVRISDYGGH